MGYSEVISDFLEIDLEEMRPAGFHETFAEKLRQRAAMVESGHGWRKVPVCPICGASARDRAMERFGVTIWKCLGCGLSYTGLIPQEPGDIYSGDEYLAQTKQYYAENMDYRKRRFGAERLGLILKHFGSQLGNGLRLLDVGCGVGWFLEIAREAGFEVYGLEPGDKLRRWTEERLGISLWGCFFNELPLPEKFDVITMFDVIEHISDPVTYLCSARTHLSPGGIVLVFTPNMDSLGFRVLGAESSLVIPTDHAVYFTPASFKMAAQKAGLRISTLQTKGMDIADIAAKEETKNPEIAAYLRNNFSLLQSLVDASGCANHMRIVLTIESDI